MAKNDFFVLAYRILAYLYQCMKDGEIPNTEDISFKKLDIPERYWISIMDNLQQDGYIRGFKIVEAMSGQRFISTNRLEITIAGIQFMQENSAMGRAKAALKEFKEIVPGL